jgi:hypothetical protein
MWLVSFKAVKKKLKEYGKKRRQDTSLDFLEYRSKSSLGSDDSDAEGKGLEPILNPQLM